MKRLRQAVMGILLAALLWPTGTALAASYDVSASVPYDPPTQAAVINSSLNNVTVQNAAFIISGTCQVMNPNTVITVLRSGTLLGSQNCTSGTFSLQITLAEGLNTLVVRTANLSNLYGPDSSPISVTLNTPVVPPPVPPENNNPTPPAAKPGTTNLTTADNNAFNIAAQSSLTLVPQEPFTVLPDNNQVSLSFVIDGGSTPYTIELNWGDGATETKVIEKPGTYTFTHQYRSAGNYTVKGRITDVLGAVTEVTQAVVTPKVTSTKPTITKAGASPGNPATRWLKQNWAGTTVGASAVAVVGAAFWLGQSTGVNAAISSSTSANANGKTVRRAPKPKPRGKR